jgi:hypothetical protein
MKSVLRSQISYLNSELAALEGKGGVPRYDFALFKQESTTAEVNARIAQLKKEIAAKEAKLQEAGRIPHELAVVGQTSKSRQLEIDYLQKVIRDNWGISGRWSDRYFNCDVNKWPYDSISTSDKFLWMSDEYGSPRKPPIKMRVITGTNRVEYCKEILTKACSIIPREN